MIRLPPGLKIILTFTLSFLATYSLIAFITQQINNREIKLQNEGAKVLQREVGQKFQYALDVSRVIGEMSSLLLSNQTNSKEYEQVLEKQLKDKEYIVGLNQLNANGEIISVFPREANIMAIGKLSQNYQELKKSYEQGDAYWFSPPFKLFQGSHGFAFYTPIEKNNKLLGWIATVINSEKFFKHFQDRDFFIQYDFVIKDKTSDSIYFETGLLPNEGPYQEISGNLWKREIIFISWPKSTHPYFQLPFYLRFIICLTVSFFCALFMKIHLQRKKAFGRLKDISELLKLTSNDLLVNLMDIQNMYLSKGTSLPEGKEKEIQTATNLYEQIELLQNIAEPDLLLEETFEVLPLLKEQMSSLQEVVAKKKLRLKVESETFHNIIVTGNKWLISNTVFKNALSYCVLVSNPEAKITITHTQSEKECSTIFYIERIIEEEISKAFRSDRRLLVAQNVMNLLNGEITIRQDDAGGMFLKLTIDPQFR